MNKLISVAFIITALGFGFSVIKMNECMIAWGLAYLIICGIWQVISIKEEREDSLKYIRR